MMLTRNIKGRLAEKVAKWVLRAKGYRILAERFRCPVGEIDLIAKRKRTLVAIEVKSRSSLASALESISPKQQRRVIRTLQWYAKQHRGAFEGLQFDVFVVSTPFLWQHLKNAWQTATSSVIGIKADN